jgi:predicted phage-related endonuclease
VKKYKEILGQWINIKQDIPLDEKKKKRMLSAVENGIDKHQVESQTGAPLALQHKYVLL